MDCLDFTTKNKNFFTLSPAKSPQSHQKSKQIHCFHWKDPISCESILTNVEKMFGQHCPCGRQHLPWKLKPIPLRLPQRGMGMGSEWANTGRMLWQRMGQRGKKFWRITIRKQLWRTVLKNGLPQKTRIFSPFPSQNPPNHTKKTNKSTAFTEKIRFRAKASWQMSKSRVK